MRKVPVANAKARLSAYLDEAESSGPVVITRNGKPVAVLLAMQDEDEIERMILAYSPKFQALLKESHQSIEAGKGLSHDEFWKAVKQRGKRGK